MKGELQVTATNSLPDYNGRAAGYIHGHLWIGLMKIIQKGGFSLHAFARSTQVSLGCPQTI
jgi:hypothetical protein